MLWPCTCTVSCTVLKANSRSAIGDLAAYPWHYYARAPGRPPFENGFVDGLTPQLTCGRIKQNASAASFIKSPDRFSARYTTGATESSRGGSAVARAVKIAERSEKSATMVVAPLLRSLVAALPAATPMNGH